MNAVMVTKTRTARLGTETGSPCSAPVEWRRGLVCPDRVHIAETEDGAPRTMDVGSGTVVIATCQAWLGGDPMTGVEVERLRLDRCVTCGAIADAVLGGATESSSL